MGRVHAAGRAPAARGRVVELGGAPERPLGLPPPASSTRPLPSRVAVAPSRPVVVVPRAPASGAGVVQLCVSRPAGRVGAARDQDGAVGQQRGGVVAARGPEAAGQRPAAGRRVVQLGARLQAVEGVPADDEHAPVAEAGPGEGDSTDVHAPGRRPAVRRGVVQFRARAVLAAGDEHTPVGETHGDVQSAPSAQRPGRDPGAGGRVVQLGGGGTSGVIFSTDHEDAPVTEPRRGQARPRGRHACRRAQLPLRRKRLLRRRRSAAAECASRPEPSRAAQVQAERKQSAPGTSSSRRRAPFRLDERGKDRKETLHLS